MVGNLQIGMSKAFGRIKYRLVALLLAASVGAGAQQGSGFADALPEPGDQLRALTQIETLSGQEFPAGISVSVLGVVPVATDIACLLYTSPSPRDA